MATKTDDGYRLAHTAQEIDDGLDGAIKNLSVSGKVITYTKGDGTTGTITTQDTTYTALKNPYALTLQFNGATNQSYDGSAAKTFNVNLINAGSGLVSNSLVATPANTTEDSGWQMITADGYDTVNGKTNGFWLKSIRTQLNAPPWLLGNYAAGICFGGADTKGVISLSYGSPSIRFAGGNGSTPKWYITLTGTAGASYNLANFKTTDTNYYPTAWTWKNGTTAGPTASLSGSGMSAISIAAIPSASASASGIMTTGAQTLAGEKTFSSVMHPTGGSYLYGRTGTSGTAGYVHICQLKITGTYQNEPFVIEFTRRGDATTTCLYIAFASANTTDPTLSKFMVIGATADAYINKSDASTWDVYIKKTEAYDDIGILRYHKPSYMSGVSLTWTTDMITAAIDGWTQATWGGTIGTAAKLGTANVGSATQPVFLLAGVPTPCTYTLGKSVPVDAVFTDKYVHQSVSTTANYRPVLLGYTNSTDATALTGAVTNQVYVASGLYFQPSTGTLLATKFSGNGAALTSLNAANISSGTLAAARLPSSGAAAGSYGPSANASPTHGGTFSVPFLTVDAYGRVTAAATKTITLPADNNTDTKVTQTVTTSNASYPLLLAPSGQTATATTTAYFDSGVTLNPSTNTIAANISGNAATATSLSRTAFTSTKTTSSGYIHLFESEISSSYGGLAGVYSLLDGENTFFGIFGVKYRNGASATTAGSAAIYWLSSSAASPPALTLTREVGDSSITYRIYISIPGAYRTYHVSRISYSGTNPTAINTIVTDIEGTSVSTASAVIADKIGTANVGGTAKPIYLNAGTPTALSATVGSTTQPAYMNAGTITVCSGRTVPGIKSAVSVTTLGWGTNNTYVADISLLAYWNGAYKDTASNLAYCAKGAFGTVVTKAYTDSTSASAIGTGTSVPTERDIYYGLPTINGSHAYTSSTNIYAPTAVGTSGNVLISSGDGAPAWAAQSALAAGSAANLATARTIDGVSFDGSAAIAHYGTCSTAAATAAKVVALTGFTLVTGATIKVKFTNANTATAPTLNVNSTGAKNIKIYGTTAPPVYTWAANATVEFVYDGTYWQMLRQVTATPIKVNFTVAGWVKNSTTGYYEQSVTCSGLLTTDDTRTRVEPVGSTDAEAQALTDEAYSMIDYVACTTAGKLYARCPDGAPSVAFSVYVIITR